MSWADDLRPSGVRLQPCEGLLLAVGTELHPTGRKETREVLDGGGGHTMAAEFRLNVNEAVSLCVTKSVSEL